MLVLLVWLALASIGFSLALFVVASVAGRRFEKSLVVLLWLVSAGVSVYVALRVLGWA